MVLQDEKVSRINVPAVLISGKPRDGNRGTSFPTFRFVPPCPAVKPRDEDTMVPGISMDGLKSSAVEYIA